MPNTVVGIMQCILKGTTVDTVYSLMHNVSNFFLPFSSVTWLAVSRRIPHMRLVLLRVSSRYKGFSSAAVAHLGGGHPLGFWKALRNSLGCDRHTAAFPNFALCCRVLAVIENTLQLL